MKIVVRLGAITYKVAKLGVLLALIRCFGVEGAEHLRASFALQMQRSSLAVRIFSKNIF